MKQGSGFNDEQTQETIQMHQLSTFFDCGANCLAMLDTRDFDALWQNQGNDFANGQQYQQQYQQQWSGHSADPFKTSHETALSLMSSDAEQDLALAFPALPLLLQDGHQLSLSPSSDPSNSPASNPFADLSFFRLVDQYFIPLEEAPSQSKPGTFNSTDMLSEPIDIISPPPPTTKIEDSSTFDMKDSKLPVKSTTSGSTADILEIKCPSCQTSFVGVKRRSNVIAHCQTSCYKAQLCKSQIDRDSPKVYCPVPNCTKTVATTNWKSNLADHFMTHDKSRVKLFVCGFAGCDKSYHRKNLMIDCRRKHKGEWFGCTLCSNQFSSRYERDRHHSTTHRSI